MFPSPRGDELFRLVGRFFPFLGMFPSPRGDELFPYAFAQNRCIPRFRPLAGMSCFSKSRQKSHKIFRAFCKDSPFEPFFAAQIMNTFPPNVDYLCANHPKIPFCLSIIPQDSRLSNNIFSNLLPKILVYGILIPLPNAR